MSIYLDRSSRGRGYGRLLYEALEAELRKMGFLNVYACIADPVEEDEYLTRNSEQFHRHLGFVKVGDFHLCGYKFGRWYNVIWMEKMIGTRPGARIRIKDCHMCIVRLGEYHRLINYYIEIPFMHLLGDVLR